MIIDIFDLADESIVLFLLQYRPCVTENTSSGCYATKAHIRSAILCFISSENDKIINI